MKKHSRVGLRGGLSVALFLFMPAFMMTFIALVPAIFSVSLYAQAAPAPPSQPGAVKQLGSIKKISTTDLTLATDLGTELVVKLQPNARLLRLAPGQTDLKTAAGIAFTDLQVGDRVLVRGKLADDGVAVNATAVIVMKQQDIAQRKQQELLDWQKRGVGGLVQQLDTQQGNITLLVGGAKTVIINTTPKTTFKRYSPESIKWEDAVPAKLDDIHPGDQLRAKGNKNDDGTNVVAEEIVAGTFRNIAGLVTSVDTAQGAITVQDLATKKSVSVKITPDSQMKKLPAQLAQGLAMRLKGITPPAAASPASPSNASPSNAAPSDPARPRAAGGDLNQLLARLPAAALGDLQKGEAVMIVSTEGSSSQPPVAITLLGGVEPILTASPTGKGAESFLTPWSLASAPGGGDQ